MPKLGAFEKDEHYITSPLNEAAYPGNMGFEEMVKFYRKASDKEIDQMEEVIRKGDWTEFKALVHKVLGVTLK